MPGSVARYFSSHVSSSGLMLSRCNIFLPVACICLLLHGYVFADLAFYVATNGNDSWSGRLPVVNGLGTDGPLLTMQRAQQVVRESLSSATGAVSVLIRNGSYYLDSPLVFDTRDSSSNGLEVMWTAYTNEAPLISGGRPVTNWFRHATISNLWYSDIPAASNKAWVFNQLYVDDQRAVRARSPNADEGDLRVTSVLDQAKRITFDKSWGPENLAGQGAELFVYHEWSCSRATVVSSAVNEVISAYPVGVLNHPGTTTKVNDFAYLENVFSFLDQPREWFLDQSVGRLYLMLEPARDPNAMTIVAPVISNLLILAGVWNKPVRGLRFKDLKFAHNLWLLPSCGFPEIQAGHYIPDWILQTSFVSPVAIEFDYAENSSLEDCLITHIGSSAIGIGAGCKSNRVVACEISDIGVNGIDVGWRGKINSDSSLFTLSQDWPSLSDIPRANIISGNHVKLAGQYASGAMGLWVAFSEGTVISHNFIENIPCSGISVGFEWYPTFTSQRDCHVEYNRVRHVGTRLADTSGIYALGSQPGSVFKGNMVSDLKRNALATGSPMNAFYLDNGSSNLVFEYNLACRIEGRPWFCRLSDFPGNSFTNNQFGLEPEPLDEILFTESTGPGPDPFPAPWMNKESRKGLSFNDWLPGFHAVSTNDGWVLSNGSIQEAREPCLGSYACLSLNSASLTYPAGSDIIRTISFWYRNLSAAPVEFDVATSSDGNMWNTIVTITNAKARWQPMRLSVNTNGFLRIKENAAGPGNGVCIENVTLSFGNTETDLCPPTIDDASITGQYLSMLTDAVVSVSAHDFSGIYSVTADRQLCAYAGNDMWNRTMPVHSGTNDISIEATDFAGNVSTRHLVFSVGDTHYVSPLGGQLPPFTSWTNAATNIQDAINLSAPGDVILVSNGVYDAGSTIAAGLATRVVITSDVAVVAVNGPSCTVISGNGPFASGSSTRCVYLSGGLLAGFTLSNGTTMANGASSADSLGGGVYMTGNSSISNCIVTKCTAFRGGGVRIGDNAQICGSIISSNVAAEMGGGLDVVGDPVIQSSIIQGNAASSWGGGLLMDYGASSLINCFVSDNSASDGGGAYLIQRNRILNSTIVNNRSAGGAGLSAYVAAEAAIVNSIVYSNFTGATHSNYSVVPPGQMDFSYCCTYPLAFGLGNITNNPGLHGDGIIVPESPCMDAGDNQAAYGSIDLHGNPRITRIVDIGSCEVPSQSGDPAVWFVNLATSVSHDVASIVLTGMVNSSVVGDVWVSNVTTHAGYSVRAQQVWSSPAVLLETGMNKIVVEVMNASLQATNIQATITRGAPGSGLPRVFPRDSYPPLSSDVNFVRLRGSNNEEVVGAMMASNLENNFICTFGSSLQWESPSIDIVKGKSNRIYLEGSNSAGCVTGSWASVLRTDVPVTIITAVTSPVPFTTQVASINGSNNEWVCGAMMWSNSLSGGYGSFVAPVGEGNQCLGGMATAHHLGFASAYRAFDGDEQTAWYPGTISNGWIKYDFGSEKQITGLRVKPFVTNGSVGVKDFRFEGSHDDHTWSALFAGSQSSSGWEGHSITNLGTFRWYRIYIESAGSNGIGVSEIQMTGSSLWTFNGTRVDVGTNAVMISGTNLAGEGVSQIISVVRSYPGYGDSDGDGSSDYTEWISGTDPLSSSSVFKLTKVIMESLYPVIRWSSISNRVYEVDWSTNLTGAFQMITSGIPATPPENIYTDMTIRSCSPVFYRVIIP